MERADSQGQARQRGRGLQAARAARPARAAFTRKPPKYERFVRPAALRFKKAHVTHPDLKATFQLDLIGIKKNPQSPLYTSLGVITKGTVIEVNCSDLGLVTPAGKVVWGKYAQVTNNPENDGCINAVLLV